MPIGNQPPQISPFALSLLESVVNHKPEPLSKADNKQKYIGVQFADPHSTVIPDDAKGGPPSLVKSVLNLLNGGGNTIERLAFETAPDRSNVYASLYRSKMRLLPDHILKRIAIQDSLVAAIVTARAAQLQSFGRVQPNRHSTGFKIEAKEGVLDGMSEEKKKEFNDRVERATKLLLTCGRTSQLNPNEHMTLAQFFGMTCRNAVTVGRIAVEVIWVTDPETGKRIFHSFRPIDAGTIYQAAPYKEAAQAVREEALHLLEQLKNKKLEPEKYVADEYAWVQVVEGRPLQVFTADECLVHNFYPVTDVELDGYPLTPIDTAIADITTHINITNHNKLYFQSGRASHGMLIIKSDDVNEAVIQQIKQQFNASINSVANAWRMPVFGIGSTDELTWQPIDSGARDMEFQYLSDTNSRVILSAFQMSPEELPGYAHLSRGTNNQALSESNNEYKMEAARDVGIRPLLSNFEDFVNFRLFPLIDENLSKLATIKLVGLDAETPEKESTRLAQDAQVHLTYNDIMEAVEKDPLPKILGADLPLNPMFQQILDKYVPVGVIEELLMGVQGAAKDPDKQYRRDPFFFQWLEFKAQMQAAQQQAQNPQPPPGSEGGGEDAPPQDDGQGGQPGASDDASQGAPQQDGGQQEQQPGEDLSRSLDQIVNVLSKNESKLPPSRRRLLHQHRQTVENFLKGLEKDLKNTSEEILDVADKFGPSK